MAKTIEQNKFLDIYAYAQLAAQNPQNQAPILQEMYQKFTEGIIDPLISKILSEAQTAQSHIQAKKMYDATPEDQRGDTKDPGQLNGHLTKSLQTTQEACMTYIQKRSGMISDLTVPQIINYYSDKTGKLILKLPEKITALAKKYTSKLKDLGNSEEEKYLNATIMTLDQYKVNGIINSQLEKSSAENRLKSLEQKLITA
ncbi:hypothetical protein HNV12_01415 [Methanococcoides sp. SA1]|nr:hypothetical protein [Methanococcoides sp. SA1]